MKSQRWLWSSVVLVGMVVTLSAQTSKPTFEVASIKARTGARVYSGRTSPDSFHRPDITLAALIAYGYGLAEFQITGGPEWRASRFDVNARASSAPTDGDMRLMVQSLLEDRFGLKAHTETRELDLYELIHAREDRRLGRGIRVMVECPTNRLLPDSDPGLFPTDSRPPCGGVVISRIMGSGGGVSGNDWSAVEVADLVAFLQRNVGRSVVDKTGLTGTFDISLKYAPVTLPAAGSPTRDLSLPSLFTAVQEQLGLKLGSRRGPVRVLVIDSVHPPTEN